MMPISINLCKWQRWGWLLVLCTEETRKHAVLKNEWHHEFGWDLNPCETLVTQISTVLIVIYSKWRMLANWSAYRKIAAWCFKWKNLTGCEDVITIIKWPLQSRMNTLQLPQVFILLYLFLPFITVFGAVAMWWIGSVHSQLSLFIMF